MAKTITWTAPYAAPVVTPSLQAGGSLTLGTTYYYRVVAVLQTGNNPWNFNNVESPASTEVSATPAGANQTIRLTWPQVAGAAAYWIHRSTISGSYSGKKRSTTAVADGGAGGTTYNDDGSGAFTKTTTATFAATTLPLGFDHTIGKGNLTISDGTSGDPITFDDIYTAIGDDTFCQYIDDSIFGLLGNWYQNNYATETHFEDTLKTVYTLGQVKLDFTHEDSEIIFGAYNSDKDYSYNGITFYHCAPTRNDLEFAAGCKMYGCNFLSYYANTDFQENYSVYGDRLKLEDFEEMSDCKIDGFDLVIPSTGVGPILNLVVRAAYLHPSTSGTDLSNADDITIKGGYLYIYYADQDRLLNFSIYPSTVYDILLWSGFSSPNDKNITMINPFFYNRAGNVPEIRWQASSDDGNGWVDILYEFDLTILDKNGNAISGATVKIEDTDGTEIVSETTDANGEIATQEIFTVRYTHKTGSGNGSGPSYTDTDAQGPFTLWVSQPGYQTEYKKFSLTEKSKWILSLRRGPVAGKEAMGAAWR